MTGKTFVERCQDSSGESEIEWLNPEDRELLGFFERVNIYSGMWGIKNRGFWTGFWIVQMSIFTVIYIYSMQHYKDELHLLANIIHHTIMALDDFMYIDLLNNKGNHLKYIFTRVTKTYDYKSNLIREYHKRCMTERLKLSRSMKKLIVLSGPATFLYLQTLFILEATIFKSYETMFPIHLPINISHPVVFSVVVILQESQIYITLAMGSGISALVFISWNYLTLELDVLKFGLIHVEDLVSEKLQNMHYKTTKEREQAQMEIYNYYCYHFARHHHEICRYFIALRKSSTVTIASLFLTGLICFACVGITSISDNVGVKYKFIQIMALQTAAIYAWCWVGENIKEKNSGLIDVIAGIHWWRMPKTCHSTLLLMMIGCKMPMNIETPIGQAANNESFMDMASSSYRVFSLVYQMKFSS